MLVKIIFNKAWCTESFQLIDLLEEISKEISVSFPNITYGTVEATLERELANNYKIDGYPTLFLFLNGEPIEYKGWRKKSELKTWIINKVNPSVTGVFSLLEIQKYQESYELVALFIGTRKYIQTLNTYKTVSTKFDRIIFLFTFEESIALHYKISINNILLFRKFDEPLIICNYEFTIEKLSHFFKENEFKLISEFAKSSIKRIFVDKNPAAILFLKENEASTQALSNFTDISKQIKGKLLLFTSRLSNSRNANLSRFMGIQENEFPSIRILSPIEDDAKKYVMTGELSPLKIFQFVEDFRNGNLRPYYKSEDLPVYPSSDTIQEIVGKSFNDIVIKGLKDNLIGFYAPWCSHCEDLRNLLSSLSNSLSNSITSIDIGMMDATANEFEDLNIEEYPTLILFPKLNKKNPIVYEGERTLLGLLKFLVKHTKLDY